MANTKISALPAVASLTGPEQFPVVQGGATRVATVQQLVAAFQGGLLQDLHDWQPATTYTAGELVLNSSGQIVSANTTFTSGASYDAANWTVVTLNVSGVQALIAQQATTDSATYTTLLTPASSYTWNTDGTIESETIGGITTTFGWNTDGTLHTETRNGVTRTYTYNTDGTLASIA